MNTTNLAQNFENENFKEWDYIALETAKSF